MPEMLAGLFGGGAPATWIDAAIGVLASFVAGQLLSWVYEATYSGLSYSRKFADTLALLTTTCCGFVLIARQSLMVGLGLMAVLSIIRFRSNVKTPNDLVFVLAAATFGLGCGAGALEITAVGFAGFVVFTIFVSATSIASRRRFDAVLRLRTDGAQYDAEEVEAIMERHCLRSVLLSSAEFSQGDLVEHSYQVKLLGPEARQSLLTALRGTKQVQDVRLLLQEVNLEY